MTGPIVGGNIGGRECDQQPTDRRDAAVEVHRPLNTMLPYMQAARSSEKSHHSVTQDSSNAVKHARTRRNLS
jgi:hypothetical protein